MSVSKYVSDVKIIPHNIEVIFHFLSDFENLSKYFNEDVLSAISEKVKQIKISNFESDHDSCRFEIGGLGKAEIRIIEKTPFTTIKIEGQGNMPVEIKFWIQLLPLEAYKTKMRLTLHAEMGMMVRMMAGNKLEKGIDQLADALAVLPYQ
jgi:Carbon monoxide dehydrogenase subunit G (CoxG)